MSFAQIGMGLVRHRRLRPREHAFAYASYFLWLPMRSLRREACAALNRNGRHPWRHLLSFHDADHGEGGGDALAWLEALLAAEGIEDADGEVWLQTYPRVLGHVFKPVSFWFCERKDGSLAAVVVEVNNTFGERHCYLLRGAALAWGSEQQAAKVFHVSPFCRIEGRYRFRFMRAGERVVARVDHDDAQGALLNTSLSGQLQPLNARSARAAFFAMPALTLMVVARIHWQALQLAFKRLPFFSKPEPPERFVTR
ncbi:MAG TPA: DUF1365 domain-containing protein [Roseateles sp.]